MPIQSNLLPFGGRLDPSKPSLPIEVEEHALSYLDRWEDATTIANCAQVCRRWLPSSRYKLYGQVAIRSPAQWELFERLLLSHRQDPSPAGGLSRYLEAVHELIIGSVIPLKSIHDEKEAWTWANAVFVGCAPHLHTVKHLVLSSVLWEEPQDFNHVGLYYPSVTTLETRACMFRWIGDLNNMVSKFPALNQLCIGLGTSQLFSGDSLFESPPAETPPLSRLEVHAPPGAMSDILEWFRWIRWPWQRITECEWRPIAYEYERTISEDGDITEWFTEDFLSLMSSLQVLRCTLDSPIVFSQPQFANLRVLDISYPDVKQSNLIKEVFRVAKDLRGNARQLEELQIEYRLPAWPKKPIDLRRLRALNDILSSSLYPVLRKFSLKYVISARPNEHLRPVFPIDFDATSVTGLLAMYDSAPIMPMELLGLWALRNSGLVTERWVEILVRQTENILRQRLQDNLQNLSTRISVNSNVSMHIFLDDRHGWADDYQREHDDDFEDDDDNLEGIDEN